MSRESGSGEGYNDFNQLRNALYQLAGSPDPSDQQLARQLAAQTGMPLPQFGVFGGGSGDVGYSGGPEPTAQGLPAGYGQPQSGLQPAAYGEPQGLPAGYGQPQPGLQPAAYGEVAPQNVNQDLGLTTGSDLAAPGVGQQTGQSFGRSAPEPPALPSRPDDYARKAWGYNISLANPNPTNNSITAFQSLDPVYGAMTPSEAIGMGYGGYGGTPGNLGPDISGDRGGSNDNGSGGGSDISGDRGGGDDRRMGGPIKKSGPYNLHKGEHVMNPEATEMVGPKMLEDINKGALGRKANKKGLTGPASMDTELAHITPREKAMLAKKSGGVKRNPVSGLMAFWAEGGDQGDNQGGGNTTGIGDGPAGSDTGIDTMDSSGHTPAEAGPGPGGTVDRGLDPTGGNAYGGGGIGTTEGFGGNYEAYNPPTSTPSIMFVPQAPAPQSAAATSVNLDQMIKDLETYQPIGYQGNWLTYAMPSGTFGGAQHRFQRRTNDPNEGNANVYAADTTYNSAAWPNVPGTSQGIAALPGAWTGAPAGLRPNDPLNQLKSKAGYGIMGLM